MSVRAAFAREHRPLLRGLRSAARRDLPRRLPAGGRGHRQLDWPSLVSNDGPQQGRAGWDRRLDQRARRSQDGQRDAEGDGPQHHAIVAFG